MNKQTSVEWLWNEIYKTMSPFYNSDKLYYYDELLKIAKEMHKQEIMDSYSYGQFYKNTSDKNSSELYYNETFLNND